MMMMMSPQQQQQQQQPQPPPQQQQQPPQQRHLVLVVEGTAALAPTWPLLLSDYIEKIVRAFCAFNATGQKHTGSTGEMALVVYYSHGSYNGCLLQQSGWTSSIDVFFRWLASINFVGGGFGEAAVAEGLAEALLMCCPGPNVPPVPQGRECQNHCILIGASNPHRAPTPVHSPPVTNFIQSQGNNGDLQAEHWWLADADTVAQAFPACSVSLSVVAPRELPQLRNIFSQAKRVGVRAPETAAETPKQYGHHLVLLSEYFLEGKMALHRTGMPNSMAPNGLTAKVEHQTVSVTPSTAPGQLPPAGVRSSSGIATGIGVLSGRPGSNVAMPPVTVKTEAVTTGTLSSLLHNNANNNLPLPMQQLPSSSQDTLQSSFSSLTSPDQSQDFKGLGNIPSSQPLRPVGATSLPSSTLMVHSPSPSRHTIGSPSSGLQPSGGGGPVSSIMSTGPGVSSSLSVAQGPLGVSGQPGVVGMVQSTGGLGVVQGVGVGNVHTSYNSGTNSLGGNTMLGSTQTPSSVNIGVASSGQGSVTGLSVQGGLNSAIPMGPSGINLPGQTIMNSVGNTVGSSGTGSMMPTPGVPQSPGQVQPLGVNNTGVPAPLHAPLTSGTPPQPPSNNPTKYTRLWEGILAGQRKGNAVPIPICKLEGYRQTSSPETLALDWPQTMQIMRLISQEYMSNKNSKAEVLVFRPLTPHDFLVQLAEKKLCAVVQLPSQTLLLASTDKPGRMIGMLFPGDMVQIKPQISSQQQAVSGGAAPQAIVPNNFSQNQLANNQLTNSQIPQNQLTNNQLTQNQLANNQLTNPLANPLSNQAPRPQLLSVPPSLHGTGFLP